MQIVAIGQRYKTQVSYVVQNLASSFRLIVCQYNPLNCFIVSSVCLARQLFTVESCRMFLLSASFFLQREFSNERDETLYVQTRATKIAARDSKQKLQAMNRRLPSFSKDSVLNRALSMFSSCLSCLLATPCLTSRFLFQALLISQA